jgi:predicted metal-dependent phosphoesterase TrpH
MLKTLIHVHTDYSFDSNITLENLLAFARHNGFGCLAVTDHDTIEGALRLRHMTDIRVIVGEEISTQQGHLVGLFLEKRVPPGMSARDSALAIREQGGLVFAPHPFVGSVGCGLGRAVYQITDLLDAVEVCNGQNLLPTADRRARRFAAEAGLPGYVGADSHAASSIAPCYQFLRDFNSPAEFRAALGSAELHYGYHPVRYFAGAIYRTARHLSGLSLPKGFGARASRNHVEPRPSTAASVAPA